MILRELLEALHYPSLLRETVIEHNVDPVEVLDCEVVFLTDQAEEFVPLSTYLGEDGKIYVDLIDVDFLDDDEKELETEDDDDDQALGIG